MRLRPLILLLVLVLAAGLAACGGDDGDDGGGSAADAEKLVEQAFNTTIDSGRMAIDAEARFEGGENPEQFSVELSGPFESNGADRLPSLDLDVDLSGAGIPLEGGLIVTEDNAFLRFQDEHYEIGRETVSELNRQLREQSGGGKRTTLRQFGLDVGEWLQDPKVEGSEEVAGVETTKVSGGVDVLRVVDDFVALEKRFPIGGSEPLKLDREDREKIEEVVRETRLYAYVAKADHTLRRLLLEVDLDIPEEDRDDFDGAERGNVRLDVVVSDAGKPQRIEAPARSKPLDELLSQFGLGAESFLQ